MRRLPLAVILSLLLLMGCRWSSAAVTNACAFISEAVAQGDYPLARTRWQQSETLLGALLLHEELDAADRLLTRLQTETGAERAADRAELIRQLQHLTELDRPSIRNLF